jgi:hypothetical protein
VERRRRAFGRLHTADNVESPSQPAAVITPLGRGRIAATSFDLGQDYAQARSPGLRRFVNDLARELFPQPLVEVRGSTDVDVSLARNRGQLLVNLVNTGGPHQSAGIIEAIPPVGPLAVTIRQPTKPVQVNLEPGGKAAAVRLSRRGDPPHAAAVGDSRDHRGSFELMRES